MRIIPYEDKRAVELLDKKNVMSKSLKNDLCILGKYYKTEISNNKEEIKHFLRHFCQWKLKDYNEVLYFDVIRFAVNYSVKNNLFIAEPVIITKKELNECKKIKDIQKEQVLFTILVLSKLYNQKIELKLKNEKLSKKQKEKLNKSKYFFKESLRDIFKEAHVKILSKEKEDLIIDLYKNKFISISNNSFYKPLIISEDYTEDEDDDIVLQIDVFQDIGLQYLLYRGVENIIQCENCGRFIIQNSNTIKYCRRCAKEIKLEQTRDVSRESMRKLREKRKC